MNFSLKKKYNNNSKVASSVVKISNFLQYRKKAKLKKKWRFWRSFKFYFLRKKSLSYFSKLKWLFNQNRIMWHHFSNLYGKNIKYLVFKKTKTKLAFGKPFFNILSFLELRLNILLVRMRFASKLLEADSLITGKLVYVNGFLKQKHYLVRVNDIVKKVPLFSKKSLRFFSKKWRYFKWKKWRRKARFNGKIVKVVSMFRFSKKIALSLNYLELNYRILTGIVIRKPVLGEILISSSKKILSLSLLKKIYFLY